METTTMRHLRLAAESGDAAAQFNLGVLFDSREDDNGYAIEGNRTQAIKWLLAAAEQGLPRAQSRLAELYAGGPNASGNLVNACAWFLLATKSSRGIHRHQARSEYERISTRLTPAQITKARLVICRSARPGLRAFGGSPIRRSSRSFLAGRKCCRRRAPKRSASPATPLSTR